MRTHRNPPSVHAGSMADIAFLLLIFFLVTTTIAKDKGIARKLPGKCPPGQECKIDILDRNVLRIFLNENGQLMVNQRITPLDELGELLKRFIDNNGDGSCTYCAGEGLATSSENPSKAVISLNTDRLTPYAEFITVQDELTRAYLELRKKYARDIFNKVPSDLSESELDEIKLAYPFLISEADLK